MKAINSYEFPWRISSYGSLQSKTGWELAFNFNPEALDAINAEIEAAFVRGCESVTNE